MKGKVNENRRTGVESGMFLDALVILMEKTCNHTSMMISVSRRG
jgi:hypothetical protein